jgi:nucleoid DNA-binding protein
MAKAAKKAPTKTEIITNVADATDLTKKQVAAVFDALAAEIKKSMSPRGPGVFAIPGLVKITKKKIPAQPAQKNWRNPFTGEIQERPAKPARVKVRLTALKALKDVVAK